MLMSRIEYFYKTRSIILIGRKLYLKKSLLGICINKISLSVSPKDIVKNAFTINEIYNIIYLIANQRPITTKARKSISSFKIRLGMILGVKVSLRNANMYNFLDGTFNLEIFTYTRWLT